MSAPTKERGSAGRLSGKVAVITGAARGQGEAIARLFVAEGAKVELLDVLAEQGQILAKELGDAAVFTAMDISQQAEWTALMTAIEERHGGVDILVNNAGITQLCPFEEISVEQYYRLFEVNELAIFLGMQAVFPSMKARGGGSIVNTSSGAALQAPAGMAAYTATKMGVIGLTRGGAGEWGSYGIRVNAILPGAIDTPMLRGPHTTDVDFTAFFSINPIPRAGEPSEIADVALFLASDSSSYVTGTAIPVDGGRSSGRPIPRS
jgi:3alpha(or 20beta)-hydroxysteroid dehydrogenase